MDVKGAAPSVSVARLLRKRVNAESPPVARSARRLRILPIVLLVAATCPNQLRGEVLDDQVETYVAPLRERLALEVEFVSNASELSHDQLAALREAAQAEIDRIMERVAILERAPAAKRKPRLVRVGDEVVLVAAGVHDELVTAPEAVAHQMVSQALKARWPDAWETCDAERRRLESRRRQAGILTQVAALDEVARLSDKQRTDVTKLLDERADDGWWRASNATPHLDPRLYPLQSALTCGNLGAMTWPEPELSNLLRPSQRFQHNDAPALRPNADVVVRKVPAQRAAAKRIVVALDAQRPEPAVQAIVVQRQAVALHRQVIRQRLTPDEQRRLLAHYIERQIDYLDAVCGLSQVQREKLALAGKLDIEQLAEQPGSENEPLAAARPIANGVTFADLALAPEIFSREASYFRRALRTRLLDDQKQNLIRDERERREFQRRALVEAAVAGFERAAVLTPRQCEALSSALNGATAENDVDAPGDWRLKCVQSIAQLPQETFDSILSAAQRPAAARHQAQLAEAAGQFAAQVNDAAPRGGVAGIDIFLIAD